MFPFRFYVFFALLVSRGVHSAPEGHILKINTMLVG